MENFERENDVLAKYRAIKNREEEEHKKEREKSEKKQNEEKERILELLKDKGVPNEKVETNGYWFHFTYKGMFIDFVNQESRLCGVMYKTPHTDEERQMLKDAEIMISEDEDFAKGIRSEYNYEDFIWNGNPVDIVEKVLELAESKGLEG